MAAKKNGSGLGRPDLKQAETMVNSGKDAVEAVIKASNEAATKQYEQAFEMTKENVERTTENLNKGYEEFAEFNQSSVDALMQSSTLMAEGIQDVAKQFATYAQSAVEENVDMTKKMFAAKNLQEVMDLQSTVMRKQFDDAVSQGAKLTELSFNLTNRAYEPFQTQMTQVVEKFMKPLSK